jgi:two-component system chemotaxis sensor kinase CheA
MLQDDDLIAEFVVESNEHLADIESQLLAIEAAGAEIDIDLVNKVFRAIHSIKGAAGFLGLATVNRLAHVMENVLNLIRNRELVPTPANIEVILKSADELRSLLENVKTSNERDVSYFVAELEKYSEAPSDGAPEAKPIKMSHAPAPEPEQGIKAMEQSPHSVSNALSEPAIRSGVSSKPETPASAAPSTAAPAPTTSAAPATAAAASSTPAESSIRISVSVVDRLMNLAGELVLSRNQLLQAHSRNDHSGLSNATTGLNHVTSELQEAIMRTRMQPIGTIFGRFPRVVRDLSAKLGKQVELQIEGNDVEVDKTIIEAIGDPLTHLIRNSIDHGLEAPTTRESRGKKATGMVRLRAYHQAGKMRIDIEDDGGGIDPAKLRAKAISMGILTEDRAQHMSDRDAIRLIFHPGLSTAAKVSDVSGRGVGMDVVKTNIEKLGGSVDVESTIHVGTAIRITLPLTLAIIPSLVVSCQQKRFAISQANIVELVRVRAGEASRRVNHIKDKLVLRLRDTLLPLVRLDVALGRSHAKDISLDQAFNIIVVESSELRYGLIVDALHDSEEIVVKPLGRHVKDCSCLSGATILGDGRIALILDIDGIGRRMELQSVVTEEQTSDEEKTGAETDQLKLLMFSIDPADRFAFPSSMVTRIERIRPDQLDTLGGQEILQFHGTTLPLLGLEKQFRTRPRPQSKQMFVIVFSLANREVGIVVQKLEDIHEVSANIDTITLREPGISGSLVVNDKTVRLLDVYELGRALHPEWFGLEKTSSVAAPHIAVQNNVQSHDSEKPSVNATAPLIVLAEDSPFFRKQVTGFLTSEGYRVNAFEDGRKAWDYLTREKHDCRLVLTDIEMPIMTGLQLSRHVKDHPQLGKLPVIAMTTLAGDEDVQRGFDAGVDDYQIKMDREQLLNTVRRLLSEYATAAAQQPQETCA